MRAPDSCGAAALEASPLAPACGRWGLSACGVAGVYSRASRMASELPRLVEPLQLAQKGWTASGVVPRDAFHRVLLANAAADVTVKMWADESGAMFASGRIAASLVGRCERCLEALDLTVNAEFRWLLLSPGTNGLGSPDWDEVELTGTTVDLYEMLEDELLLCTPPYPKHVLACGAEIVSPRSDDDPAPPKRPSPFAVLSRLMGDGPTDVPGSAATGSGVDEKS